MLCRTLFCLLLYAASTTLGYGQRAVPKESLPPILPPYQEGVPKEIDNQPFPAHRIIDNIYYVGTRDFTSFLITSSQGHILINPGWPESVPLVQSSVRQLGFRFEDIKILLNSHAHVDHCGGTTKMKELTGAQVMVMDRDVPAIENG